MNIDLDSVGIYNFASIAASVVKSLKEDNMI